MKKQLNIPKFKSENEERKFWAKVKLNEYFNKDDFEPVAFPNLKPSSRAISLRLPMHLLIRLKERANAQMVPYQALIKSYIHRGLANS